MSDIQKVLKTLEMSEAIAERCVLTCVDCGNLNEHIYNLNQRIAELEAEIQEYRCLCEDWALVETDDSIKLAMIEASKPEVNNE